MNVQRRQVKAKQPVDGRWDPVQERAKGALWWWIWKEYKEIGCFTGRNGKTRNGNESKGTRKGERKKERKLER